MKRDLRPFLAFSSFSLHMYIFEGRHSVVHHVNLWIGPRVSKCAARKEGNPKDKRTKTKKKKKKKLKSKTIRKMSG